MIDDTTSDDAMNDDTVNGDLAIGSITRRSLHAELVDRLRDLIVETVLAPGAKIPERELCERFGVSRTPLREALKFLAAEGLVYLAPNRGAWVSKLDLAELEDLFPVMAALEALSGELACARITERQLEAIRRLHEEMLAHYQARRLTEYFRVNQRIHESILAAADNATLTTQYRSLAMRVRRARYLANMSDARWRQAVEEHVEILAALEKRSAVELADLLKRHLKNKFEMLREWFLARSENGSP